MSPNIEKNNLEIVNDLIGDTKKLKKENNKSNININNNYIKTIEEFNNELKMLQNENEILKKNIKIKECELTKAHKKINALSKMKNDYGISFKNTIELINDVKSSIINLKKQLNNLEKKITPKSSNCLTDELNEIIEKYNKIIDHSRNASLQLPDKSINGGGTIDTNNKKE